MGRTLPHLGPVQRDQCRTPSTTSSKSKDKRKPMSRSEQLTPNEIAVPPNYKSTKLVPLELQQLLLNIFADGLTLYFTTSLPTLIQQVKRSLYERDFLTAFGRDDVRAAYAARWSPSRALTYTHILANLPHVTAGLLSNLHDRPDDNGVELKSPCVVCIGAGAGAELVALGGFLKLLTSMKDNSRETLQNDTALQPHPQTQLGITAIDLADWTEIAERLYSSLTTAPSISSYASPKVKASNTPMVDPECIDFDIHHQDILNMSTEDMGTTFASTSLVTLMFTLNELYTTSISATTNLLLSLTMLLDPGALLLVVDSPGSYSTVNIGTPSSTQAGANQEKKYPMQWLLDHTLLEASAVGSSKTASGVRQWEKLESRESDWFRLDRALRYPLDLEDMRYQLHLYRRI